MKTNLTEQDTFSLFFGEARWICASDPDAFPVIRRDFTVRGLRKATLHILGFGGYRFFLNGVPGTEERFLPLDSDFEERHFPADERMTSHRVYVNSYDITGLLREGANALSVFLGNFWYTGTHQDLPYGTRKAVYRLLLEEEGGTRELVSDGSEKWRPSYITESALHFGETQDFTGWDPEALTPAVSAAGWESVAFARPVVTRYLSSDCPRDLVEKELFPVLLSERGNEKLYDIGENTSVIPVVRTAGNGPVTLLCSELLNEDGTELFEPAMHRQHLVVNADRPVTAETEFTWLACRYFKLSGDGELLCARKVHMAVPLCTEFESDNDTLNWFYRAFVNTELSNLHAGIPSDCPHIERRGYTGDGQLTSHAVMSLFDAKSFYDKWIDDISDCQDTLSGHVQYTAPYTHCGGGIGGWGGAIVIVPYQYYRHYGDDSKLRAMFGQMLRYFDYVEAHSRNGLVVSDKEGCWNLGDWCPPDLKPDYHAPGNRFSVVIPVPYVNTYFYIKTLQLTVEIARLLGREELLPELEKRIAERKDALVCAYYDPMSHNFAGNLQGSNAFALDIGLGDELTRKNFIDYYDSTGHYDTGIFGTDLVTKWLFLLNRGDIAVRLLTASEPVGFGRWKQEGLTAIPEYFTEARSYSHPMFGAVVSCFPEFLAGIRQKEGSAAYRDIELRPVFCPSLRFVSCTMGTPSGRITVRYRRSDEGTELFLSVPEGVRYELVMDEAFGKVTLQSL